MSSPGEFENQRIGALIVAGGRDLYLTACVRTLERKLSARLDLVVVVDSSIRGIQGRTVARLGRLALDLKVVHAPGATLESALNLGWESLSDRGIDLVFHIEEDFLFLRRVQLDSLARLASDPTCAQVLLIRQRWYRDEFEHGSWTAYLRGRFGTGTVDTDWLELRGVFSFNPSLYRLDNALKMLARTGELGDGPLEPRMFKAASELGLRTLVSTQSGRPDVLHIGALVTSRHRRLAELGRLRAATGYARAHLGRIRLSTTRLLHLGRRHGATRPD